MAKYHKVVTKPTPESTYVVSKKGFNIQLALALADSGRIFISNMGRSEAWRSAVRFSRLLGQTVKQFPSVHMDDKGVRYDGYLFRIVSNVPAKEFPPVCPHCGRELQKTDKRRRG